MSAAPNPEAVKRYNEGAEHFKKKEYEAATEAFKAATEIDPQLYRAWAYLGMACAQLGQLDPAIEAYRKCIEIEPTYHKAFNNIGELYRRKGLLDYAAMVFKMATEIDPSQSHYFYNLGITYFEIGMHPQAEEAFASACKLDPNDFEYLTEYSQAQFALKKYREAAETLSKFVAAHPEHERAVEIQARLKLLQRRAAAEQQPAPSPDQHKSEIRRVPIEDDEKQPPEKPV